MDSHEAYQEFYYSTVCHVCKMKCRELKSCKNCKVYKYCSQEHQILDWPNHKTICNILRKFALKLSLENCFSSPTGESWLLTRLKVKMVLENDLRRPLKPAENQVWMFPRSCAVCNETDTSTLTDCLKCPSASYCSTKHKALHKETHDRICQLMHLQYSFYCMKMRGEADGENYNKNYNTFEDAANVFKLNYSDVSDELLRRLQEADQISHAVTLYSALKDCSASMDKMQTLVVHVVGATYEWRNLNDDIIKNFMHWIPGVSTVHLVYIGPELLVEELTDSNLSERSVRHTFQPVLYEEYFYSDKYTQPNVVVAYNCGFNETENMENDSWRDTLPLLLQPTAPLIITSYTESEAIRDFHRIMQLSSDASQAVTVYKQHQVNLFHSPLPLRDWIKADQVYFVNFYYSVFMKE